MYSMNWADIRQALKIATAELRKVDNAWTDDASTVMSAAVSMDTNPMNRMRNLADPGRLQQLHQAISINEHLVDEMGNDVG